jgi:hypothetical protein
MRKLFIYIKPDGHIWFDLDFNGPEYNAQTVWQQLASDGAIQNPFFVIPRDSILFMKVVEIAGGDPNVKGAMPTVTPFPGVNSRVS